MDLTANGGGRPEPREAEDLAHPGQLRPGIGQEPVVAQDGATRFPGGGLGGGEVAQPEVQRLDESQAVPLFEGAGDFPRAPEHEKEAWFDLHLIEERKPERKEDAEPRVLHGPDGDSLEILPKKILEAQRRRLRAFRLLPALLQARDVERTGAETHEELVVDGDDFHMFEKTLLVGEVRLHERAPERHAEEAEATRQRGGSAAVHAEHDDRHRARRARRMRLMPMPRCRCARGSGRTERPPRRSDSRMAQRPDERLSIEARRRVDPDRRGLRFPKRDVQRRSLRVSADENHVVVGASPVQPCRRIRESRHNLDAVPGEAFDEDLSGKGRRQRRDPALRPAGRQRGKKRQNGRGNRLGTGARCTVSNDQESGIGHGVPCAESLPRTAVLVARQRAPGNDVLPPFPERNQVLLPDRLGEHAPAGGAPNVRDDGTRLEERREAHPAKVETEVDVLEVRRRENGVESSGVEERAAAQDEARGRSVVHDPPEPVFRAAGVVPVTEQLRVAVPEQEAARFLQAAVGVENDGSGRGETRVVFQRLNERGKPAWPDEAIAVQEREVRRPRKGRGVVARRSESDVRLAEDEAGVGDVLFQATRGEVGRRVVDDDDLVARLRVFEKTSKCGRDVVPSPIGHDENRHPRLCHDREPDLVVQPAAPSNASCATWNASGRKSLLFRKSSGTNQVDEVTRTSCRPAGTCIGMRISKFALRITFPPPQRSPST